jgi:hypothetical protein
LVPAPFPVPLPDPDLISNVFQQQKFVQNLAFSKLEAALFPRKLASNFDFLTTLLHFLLDPGSNPVPEPHPEPEFITIPDLLRQNVAVPDPVPQL